jgi:hypothetical protein
MGGIMKVRYGKLLECSDLGPPCVSSSTAAVMLYTETKAIHEWYFMALRSGNKAPLGRYDWLSGGRLYAQRVTHLEIFGKRFSPSHAKDWFYLLWFLYLESNSDLVEFISRHDRFEDSGRLSGFSSGADVLTLYKEKGMWGLFSECSDLYAILLSEGADN